MNKQERLATIRSDVHAGAGICQQDAAFLLGIIDTTIIIGETIDKTIEPRYRKVRISGELILTLLSQGQEWMVRCIVGLPYTATILGYGHDEHAFYIVFHSEEWPVISCHSDGGILVQDIPDHPMKYIQYSSEEKK